MTFYNYFLIIRSINYKGVNDKIKHFDILFTNREEVSYLLTYCSRYVLYGKSGRSNTRITAGAKLTRDGISVGVGDVKSDY